MSKNYVIQWKSKVNGRCGRGTKIFEKSEADQLAAELNQEYPQIDHEVVEAQAEESEAVSAEESVERELTTVA